MAKFFSTPFSSPRKAPHPIPAGKEGFPCPLTGMFVDGEVDKDSSAKPARDGLDADPDIMAERLVLTERTAMQQRCSSIKRMVSFLLPRAEVSVKMYPLQVVNRAHRFTSQTRELVRSVGGLPALRRFTNLFYQRAFADQHVDKFIHSHDDPHGERFASWIAEKMGDGTPWTDERRTRPATFPHDRSSAHFAAWNSHKREPHKRGDHFKPDDARVWMRLHFWAARECGLFDDHAAFMDYYVRFIAHFISVYSSQAPPFTRDSVRWSADPENIQRYLASGNIMGDVIDVPVGAALATLPADERVYSGSGARNASWPYELPVAS